MDSVVYGSLGEPVKPRQVERLDDDLNPARGILMGLIVSISLIWIPIVYGVLRLYGALTP